MKAIACGRYTSLQKLSYEARAAHDEYFAGK